MTNIKQVILSWYDDINVISGIIYLANLKIKSKSVFRSKAVFHWCKYCLTLHYKWRNLEHKTSVTNSDWSWMSKVWKWYKIVRTLTTENLSTISTMMSPSYKCKHSMTGSTTEYLFIWYPFWWISGPMTMVTVATTISVYSSSL